MAEALKSDITQEVGPTFGERLTIWYEENQNYVTIALVVVILAIAGWKIFQVMQNGRIEKAGAEYGMLLRNLSEGLEKGRDEATRKDKLTAAITDAERIAREYDGMYIGQVSLLHLGNAHLHLAAMQSDADAQQSIKNAQIAYQRFNDLTGLTDVDRAAGKLAMGNLLEDILVRSKETGRATEAVAAYQEAQKLAPGTFIDAEAKIGEARVYQNLTGQEGKAMAILDKLKKATAPAKTAEDEKALERTSAYTTQAGREFTPEDIEKIRNFTQLSMHHRAAEIEGLFKGMK